MEKEHYWDLKMEIIRFDCEDVITNSQFEFGGDEDDNDEEYDN